MNAQVKQRMNILFADDGSQHAQAAVQLLKELPLPPKSRVHVLRVFQPGQTYDFLRLAVSTIPSITPSIAS